MYSCDGYLSAAQLRAARAMAGLSQTELALFSSICRRTIARLERDDGDGSPRRRTVAMLKAAFAGFGIGFPPRGGTRDDGAATSLSRNADDCSLHLPTWRRARYGARGAVFARVIFSATVWSGSEAILPVRGLAGAGLVSAGRLLLLLEGDTERVLGMVGELAARPGFQECAIVQTVYAPQRTTLKWTNPVYLRASELMEAFGEEGVDLFFSKDRLSPQKAVELLALASRGPAALGLCAGA